MITAKRMMIDEADDHNDDNDNGGDGKGADSALPRFYC